MIACHAKMCAYRPFNVHAHLCASMQNTCMLSCMTRGGGGTQQDRIPSEGVDSMESASNKIYWRIRNISERI
jgi:hypothetical protein